jgi:D-beta-D-heptose 7-phosphate kinase/D-beta-D-heptose 1-phosphate adenosyltransferase
MGRRLVHELRELGVHTEGLIVEEGRPTTVKTRVIAHSQQVVRFDREDRVGIGKKTERLILEYVESHAGEIGGLIVSDYAKGVITARLVKELVALSEKHGFTVAVDPKVGNFGHYKGVTVLTPNNSEASQAAGIDIVDDKSLHVAGDKLLDKFKGRAVLITRGEHGMSLFERGKTPVHIPTVAKDVYDVTGAGDTVIAVFTLAMASGATMPEAAMIANQAAGIVVGEVGTATVGADELIKAIKDHK